MDNDRKFTVLVIDPQKGWLNNHTEKPFERIWSFISDYGLNNSTVTGITPSFWRDIKLRKVDQLPPANGVYLEVI